MAIILLVDDEEHILRYYTEELSEEGHKVWTVATGHKLLKRIDRVQPEVVVLDIKLDKEDPKSIAADYYVFKSFDLTELKMAIQKAIEVKVSDL
jgi:DNA-binding response OmpR family regulator